VLPVIVFFAALTSVLYHWGILQKVVEILGGGMAKLLGTRKAESVNAAPNVFVGQIEAPLVIRPYISSLTHSGLFAVMVGGLATVAGSVLVGYALLGARLGHRNVIDAAAGGAAEGLRLAATIGAMLLAFISLIALINLILGQVGGLVGLEDLTFERILGYVFAPIMLVIGVPWGEALEAGSFVGQKIVVNEFVAFTNLAPVIEDYSAKTQAVVTFALTGFANLGSLGILLGGLGSLAPERRGEIAQLGIRAILAGTLANLMSAAIAGILIG